jgi:hypothetical protein
MKLRSRLLMKLVLGLSAGAACAAIGACSTSDAGDDSAAGSGGTSAGGTGGTGTATGGSGNAAGSVATGGSSGGTAPMGTACPKAMNALLSDFSMLDGGGGDPSAWGDFTTTFSGTTFVYPNGTATYPLTADFSGENWHITGTVGDYSGFGLVFSLQGTPSGGCNLVDASTFSGISFSIKGSVPITGALADTVQLIVATAADDPASAWLNAHKMAGAEDKPDSFGTCMPVSNQYDGTCSSPTYTVPVTATATTINVKWSDLKGGKPMASPDPAKITSIAWVIPTPAGLGGASLMTYKVDLTIDDLKFLP